MIKGLFTGDGSINDLSGSVFETLETRGFTDIFYTVWADKTPTTNLTSCKNRVNEILNLNETTNLKIWLDFPALIKLTDTSTSPWNYTYTTPTDTEFISTMETNLEDILTTYDLEGICFDDYTYPSSFHVSENNAQEQEELATFAGTIKTLVNGLGCKLGLAIGYSDSPSLFADRMVYYEAVCDYVMPEVYNHATQPTTGWVYNCVKTMERTFTDSGETLLPIFINYDLTSKTVFDNKRVYNQIKNIERCNTKGYVIFYYKYLDNGIDLVKNVKVVNIRR